MNRDPKKRLGVKGSNELLSHPFLKDINVGNLLAKKIAAPFKPKLPDFNEMVRNTQQTVKIKDLNETAVPEKHKKILSSLENEIFTEFGTNLDFSSSETQQQKLTLAQEQVNRNKIRAKMSTEEETKPEPRVLSKSNTKPR